MKNIQQVAEELNVSKTTIRNYLKKLPQNLSLKKDNEHLKKDINKKDNWIEDLNILLKQQQQLQLDANKELMKYKKDV